MFPNEVSLTKVGSWKWLQEEMTTVNIFGGAEHSCPTDKEVLRKSTGIFFLYSVCSSMWGNCYTES